MSNALQIRINVVCLIYDVKSNIFELKKLYCCLCKNFNLIVTYTNIVNELGIVIISSFLFLILNFIITNSKIELIKIAKLKQLFEKLWEK